SDRPPASSSPTTVRSAANASSNESAAIAGSVRGVVVSAVIRFLGAVQPAGDPARDEHTNAQPDRQDRDRDADEEDETDHPRLAPDPSVAVAGSSPPASRIASGVPPGA